MTIICINGNQLSESKLSDLTFDQLVNYINVNQTHHEVVTQLLIDGVEVDAEDFSNKQVKRYTQVDFYTKSKASLAFDCLQSCYRYIDAILELNRSIIGNYQTAQLGKANRQFLEMVELTELFVDLFTRVNQTLRNSFGEVFKKSTESTQVEITFLSTLKQILSAKEKGDIIILCDLLEYELIDNLILWKQKVIPELERLKDN